MFCATASQLDLSLTIRTNILFKSRIFALDTLLPSVLQLKSVQFRDEILHIDVLAVVVNAGEDLVEVLLLS